MANEKAQIASVLFDAMNNGLGISDAGLNAARKGWAGRGKLNEKDAINSEIVLNDAGFLTVIPSGKQIVVYAFYCHINTASDHVDFELGVTAVADGTGTFTAMSPKFRIETPTSNQAGKPGLTVMPIPMLAKYSATAKAFTFRVKANDAGAVCTFGYLYWLEPLTEDE